MSSPVRCHPVSARVKLPCESSTLREPVRAARDHLIAPLERLNLAEVLTLIGDELYSVLSAPSQTGKTSTLVALHDLLSGESAGEYRCVHVNLEPAQIALEDVERAMCNILNRIVRQARMTLRSRTPQPTQCWTARLTRENTRLQRSLPALDLDDPGSGR